jgi:uncharacterized protein YukE
MSSGREMGQGQGALSAAAAMVSEARHDFDQLDRELVRGLVAAKAMWGGQGSSSFQALGLAWSDKQHTIIGALDHFEEALRATERDNTSTDETQSAAFARTQQRLG